MKSKLKKIAILAIYFGLIIACTKVYATTGTIAKETVRLREKATTDSSIIELIAKDQQVEILGQDGEWYKVKYNDGKTTYTGYIRQDMLKVEDEQSSSETSQENGSQENNSSEENNSQESNSQENNSSEENNSQENNSGDENNSSEENNQENNSGKENNSSEENNQENSEKQSSNAIKIEEGAQITISKKVETKILPLINSSVTGELKADTEILVTEVIGNWCYVETKNQSGWVMTSKIEQKESDEESKTEEPNQNEDNEEKNTEDGEDKTDNKDTTTSTVAETKEMYVSVTTVNLREEASSSSKILDQLSVNTKVTVIEKVDNTWSKVQVSGTTGYIATQYLSETKTEVTSRSSDTIRASTETSKNNTTKSTESSSTTTDTATTNKSTTDDTSTSSEQTSNKSNSSSSSSNSSNSSSSSSSDSSSGSESSSSSSKTTGADVVAYAKTFLGCKYVYGGTTPDGFDCSGFTQYVYKHFGYSISRTSSAQRSDGVAVKKANLQAGDLVCFSGHVGIYVGGNQFIHAENPSNGVKISSLSEKYYTSVYITARRIIK